MVDAVDGIERIRYTSPHPKDMREDVIRAHAELPALCEHIHLPLQSGSSADPEGDAAHLQPRALPRPRRDDPRARARLRADAPTSSSASRARPRPTSQQTLEVVEQVGYDGAFTFVFSPRRGTEAATLDGPGHARGQARAHGASGRGGPAPSARARPAVRRSDDGGPGRGPEPHRRRRGCAAAPGTTRRSTSRAPPSPGELVEVEIDRRDLADAERPGAPAQPRFLSAGERGDPGDLRADRGRQDGGRDRGRGAAARARRGSRSRSPATRSRSIAASRSSAARRPRTSSARLEHRLVGFVADRRRVLGRALRDARARRDRRAARRRSAADRRRRHRPLHASGARRARAAPAGPGRGARRGRGRRSPNGGRRRCTRELAPEIASGVHPNDRKRIARLTELARLGIAPHPSSEGLWSERLRVPTLLVGLTVDRDELRPRIEARVDAMVARRSRSRGAPAPRAPAPRGPRGRRSGSRSSAGATSRR